jgi:predicted  nucleic acid-binding Zn-ribbon protein
VKNNQNNNKYSLTFKPQMNEIEIPEDIFNNEFFKKKHQELTQSKEKEQLKTEIFQLKNELYDANKTIKRLERELSKCKSKYEHSQYHNDESDYDDNRDRILITNLYVNL